MSLYKAKKHLTRVVHKFYRCRSTLSFLRQKHQKDTDGRKKHHPTTSWVPLSQKEISVFTDVQNCHGPRLVSLFRVRGSSPKIPYIARHVHVNFCTLSMFCKWIDMLLVLTEVFPHTCALLITCAFPACHADSSWHLSDHSDMRKLSEKQTVLECLSLWICTGFSHWLTWVCSCMLSKEQTSSSAKNLVGECAEYGDQCSKFMATVCCLTHKCGCGSSNSVMASRRWKTSPGLVVPRPGLTRVSK